MAVNHARNFVQRVQLKKSEQCSWKRHCRGCARDVISYLEFLARKNEHRFVWPSVQAITKGCNGKYRKNAKPYSFRMVQETLRVFREHKIISERVTMTVDCVEREGFVLAPHDSMTIRYPRACVVAGRGKGPGSWVGDVWVLDPTTAEWFGKIEQTTSDNVLENVCDSVPKNVPESVLEEPPKCADECADECAGEDDELGFFEEVTDDDGENPPSVSLDDATPSLFNHMSLLSPVSLGSPENPSPTHLLLDGLCVQTPEPASQANTVPIDEPISPEEAATMRKAKDYFKGVRGRDLLLVLTDGEFDFSLCADFKNWGSLYAVLEGAVEKNAELLIRDRRSFEKILSTAFVTLSKVGNFDRNKTSTYTFPKGVYRAMKIFGSQGGPIQGDQPFEFSEERLKAWTAFREEHPGWDLEDAEKAFQRLWKPSSQE